MAAARRDGTPGGDLPAPDDQPDRAVGRGIGGIAWGRFGQPGRVRVVMTDHRRSALPRRTVRGDQRDGVDLEPVPRLGRDIGAGHDSRDPASFAQQQPAHLTIGRRRGGYQQEVQRIA